MISLSTVIIYHLAHPLAYLCRLFVYMNSLYATSTIFMHYNMMFFPQANHNVRIQVIRQMVL